MKSPFNCLISLTRAKLLLFLSFFAGCRQTIPISISTAIIATGEMPNAVNDGMGNLHLVYGNGDSILYTQSTDRGKSFSTPALVAIVPELFATSMRGPQIAFSKKGLTILASDKTGNIYAYEKNETGNWTKTSRVNDLDSVAKEGFVSLAGDGNRLFAIWLDLRGNKHNKIVGAASDDGGRTWSANRIIYTSPDSSVCECCKPSVALKGDKVAIMFRNWLNGNRDLYIMESTDGGNHFQPAQKLGYGSWALNGCPMDGGGLVINKNQVAETIWNRKGKLYACEPGKPELELGSGRSCTIETVNGENIYAWTENGEVLVRTPNGSKTNLGKGQLPLIKNINNQELLCIWEENKQIHEAILEL